MIQQTEQFHLKDAKQFLYEINNAVDQYLMSNFQKDYLAYAGLLVQRRQKNLWETIAFIENKLREEIFIEIKNIVNGVQSRAGYFCVFFENDSNIPSANKQKVLIYFPYFTADLINRWKPENQYFLVKDILTELKASNSNSKENFTFYEQIFLEIIRKAISMKVSDIHIIPKISQNAYNVFYRKDGFYLVQNEFRLKADDGEGLITYLLRRCSAETKGSQFNPDSRLSYQDARISLPEIGSYDARLAFIPDGFSLKHMEVVIRLLVKQQTIITDTADLTKRLLKMGYLEEDIAILLNTMNRNKGLFVVSGITNSGKSTLVNNLISIVSHKKVGTVEDPIEYNSDNPNIVQHQLFLSEEERLSMDFEDYIKAFKRADYDIVFIGEWRNHKGLTTAILEQAFAGQLMLTTLHISNSFQIFEALTFMYETKFEEIRAVLLLSWNQVLIPKLCEKCKIKLSDSKNIPTQAEKLKAKIQISASLDDKSKVKLNEFLSKNLHNDDLYIRNPQGCVNCNSTGYLGRQVIYDYFQPNYAFWEKLKSPFFVDVLNTAESYARCKTKVDIYLKKVNEGVLSIFDIGGNEIITSLI